MTPAPAERERRLLASALAAARDTRVLEVDAGARHRAAAVFESLFGSQPAMVVADENTFEAAGRGVADNLASHAQPGAGPFVFARGLHADYPSMERLRDALRACPAIPVAVGSGTINDLTKLAAYQAGRPYMVVATAASMDGYTSFGASITRNGSKQTFDCPAPRAVLADLEVIANAPPGMNASGYADLLAKCAAGADWILADAAGVEPIHPGSWNTAQGCLRDWLARPAEIAAHHPGALRSLVYGLMMSGFAMQALESSRPASGAEHQFSHLWDMQEHTHLGVAPSHGFKVGIGTLASLALYEQMLRRDAGDFDIGRALAAWPSLEEMEARAARTFAACGSLAETALRETRAKYRAPGVLREQLARLRAAWPGLRERLSAQLLPWSEARHMLREAGAACEPEQIGIPRPRLRLSYQQAGYIRRRYTVLDFAARWGVFEPALAAIFGPGGPWPVEGS